MNKETLRKAEAVANTIMDRILNDAESEHTLKYSQAALNIINSMTAIVYMEDQVDSVSEREENNE
jgi:hypothetical protein